MKRYVAFLSFYAALCLLLGACGTKTAPDGVETLYPPTEPTTQELPTTEMTSMTLRVVSGADSGNLLLAELGENSHGVYSLTVDPAALPLRNGQCITLDYDTILETYPAKFQHAENITVVESKTNDLCALYLRVLEDLWAKDDGLNNGAKYLSVDLSKTQLSPAERSAVAWAFAGAHGATPLELGYDELLAEGYITAVEPAEESQSMPYFPHWDEGLLFVIEETDEPVYFSLPAIAEGEDIDMSRFNVRSTVSFNAHKWRSALGAYFFSGCVAVQANDGYWGDYSIGSEAIS